MGNKFELLVACIVLCIFGSCTGKLTEQEYIDWVKDTDNGLRQVKHLSPYVFDLQYQPEDMLRLKVRKRGGDFSGPTGTQQYLLTISVEDASIDFIDYGISSKEEKQKKEYYFSYKFPDDIYLIENNEKVSCTLFHFEKAMSLKNSRTFVLGFPENGHVKETILVIDSKMINSLPIKIRISKNSIPRLVFKG